MVVRLGPRSGSATIALVVPDVELSGGISAVANFVCETIERTGAFNLRVVSLATSARDELSLSLTRPTSWLTGLRTAEGTWCGRRFTRIGVNGSEFEFQRYRPRHALTKLLGGADLIQVVSGSPAFACAVFGLGKPVAVHCATRAVAERQSRHALGHGPIEAWRRCMTRITDWMDCRALRTADAIQVMNTWMLDYVRALNAGRRSLVRFVPPGVDSDRFTPAPHRDPKSCSYILSVGRLNDPRKNIIGLLAAFAGLPHQIKAATRLILAGSAGPGPAFWTQVKALGLDGRVAFVPSPTVDQLIDLYQSATVFASSSDEEGFGVAIVEAMACGVPVVATRSGGPDGIIDDGHDGYLVGIGDMIAFTDGLTRALADHELNRRMGQAARRTVLARFDSRVAGRALLETYDALLGSRASGISETGDRTVDLAPCAE